MKHVVRQICGNGNRASIYSINEFLENKAMFGKLFTIKRCCDPAISAYLVRRAKAVTNL